jgi:hypothetical protein
VLPAPTNAILATGARVGACMTKPQGTPQAGMNSGPVRPRNRHLPASTRSHRASLATIGREQKRCNDREPLGGSATRDPLTRESEMRFRAAVGLGTGSEQPTS